MTTQAMRNSFTFLATMVLAGGAVGFFAPQAAAGNASCFVMNRATHRVYRGGGANLQTAIVAATPGTKLTVRGRCVGSFTIDKDLWLVGGPTATTRTPTLDGNAVGTVLTVSAGSVDLENLRITNGFSASGACGAQGVLEGAGIINVGDLTLLGSSRVSANVGHGIDNVGGTLVLRDLASVTRNVSECSGGGIFNENGTVTLTGSASVTENTARLNGGGIYNTGFGSFAGFGHVTLNDRSTVGGNTSTLGMGGGIYNDDPPDSVAMNGSSSVSGNRAPGGEGGGIFNSGTITLNGSASVTGNSASIDGGGIRNNFFGVPGSGLLNVCAGPGSAWTGAISPNLPDDAPTPTPVSC